MNLRDMLPRMLRDRSLRPEKRSSALLSIANSLALIAAGVKIAVLREYRIDLDSPPLSRADQAREIFAPMYPDNEKEAIREHVERIRDMEAEYVAGDTPRETRNAVISLNFEQSFANGRGSSEELTPEEIAFLTELDTEHDRE